MSEPSEHTIVCPDCIGEGVTIALHVSYADGRHGYNVPIKCSRCKGEKRIPVVAVEWMKVGRLCRTARVHGDHYQNLIEVAGKIGLTCMDVSRMEQGKADPKRLAEFWGIVT